MLNTSIKFVLQLSDKLLKMLTQEILNELFRYDPVTGVLTRRRTSKEAGTIKTNGDGNFYRQVCIAGKIYYTHRLVFLIVEGRMPEEQVDHINDDGLDNRWANLRKVSNSTNGKNVKLHVTNTSGQVGVSWNKQHSRWMSVIFVEGKLRYLGLYSDFRAAVMVRKAAEARYGFHENHGRIRSL